ncbi:MAG TPA: aldo/keto reductase [Vicinamibacterales bacterium]|nr:aldo/keto reductase [Vicinamibacterales bacterium]
MTARVPRVALAPGYEVSRIIKGGWQLAGGHGAVDRGVALDDMDAFVESGVTTFDCADIYTGVEALIGEYLARVRARGGAAAAGKVQVHTKCVPDLDRLPRLTRADIAATVTRSRERLGVEAIDLVQLHWWDYDAGDVLEAARWLDQLRRDGVLRHIGLTNFDLPHVRDLVGCGVPIRSHQLQYSLLDRRPSREMAAFCAANGIALLAYGALAGGFLSERWRGQKAPAEPLENRSLVKYRLIVDECGGWDYLQALLDALHVTAAKQRVSIGAVAIRWVLDQPGVAAAIVGARDRRHLADVIASLSIVLDDADRARIGAVLASAPGPSGDVYALERIKGGRHAAIMRYNLQQG